MEKIRKFLKDKNNIFLLLIFLIGFFLRVYKYEELFMYGHDQDLAGWIIKDIVVDKHPRLIGQETSTQGIFIGPLFYYLQIPFYFLFGMDPIGGVFLVLFLGLLTIWSINFVFSKIWNAKVGLIGAMLYSFSFYSVMNDRDVVPTTPVILWTIWFLWSLYLILNGKQKTAFIVCGMLFALTWHLNVALVLLAPLVLIAQYLSKKKLIIRNAIFAVLALILFSTPFILFELRHNFAQIKYLRQAFTEDQADIITGQEKVVRTIHLFSKNIHNFLWGDYVELKYVFTGVIFVVLIIFLKYKNLLSRNYAIIFSSWLVIYLLFFSLYSKRLSEYYLNGTALVWVVVFALFLNYLYSQKNLKTFGIMLIVLFTAINFLRFINQPVNKSGYLYKKALVQDIKNDSILHNYPCVAISYIADPGYNLGYRYFLWHNKVKTKPISEYVPVYTIVYPLKPIFKTDKDFGAIGLIYPDHKRYNPETVKEMCTGEDFNVKDSMVGYN